MLLLYSLASVGIKFSVLFKIASLYNKHAVYLTFQVKIAIGGVLNELPTTDYIKGLQSWELVRFHQTEIKQKTSLESGITQLDG